MNLRGQADWFRWEQDTLHLRLRVQPRASRDRIGAPMGDGHALKVSITAPPVDGKANAHLVAYVAKEFRVAKGQVCVVSGETGREKHLRIESPGHIPDTLTASGLALP
ncbi:MAG: DUF167 family protein [Gammaproteobacteria bacterium]